MSEPTTSREATKSGIGVFGVAAFATILFGVLKLLGLFEITWLVVFMPLIVAFGLGVLGLILGLILIAVVATVKALSKE